MNKQNCRLEKQVVIPRWNKKSKSEWRNKVECYKCLFFETKQCPKEKGE